MSKIHVLMLSTTFAVMATDCGVAAAQGGLQARPPAAFLQPVALRLILPADDPVLPRFCASSQRSQCPQVVSTGVVPGVLGLSDFKAYLPNVRVSFFIQEISNTAVANGGVDPSASNFMFVNWLTSGSAANEENGGPYAWVVPGPGQTYDTFGPHGPSGLLIYDALVIGACESFSSFPVEHQATVTESGTVIGSFTGVDNSTINSTGYYNLSYTIRAEDSDGGVSDFHFRGNVSATCSGLNSL